MYIKVVFPNSPKRYTYWSPFPVSVGDLVLVGNKTVKVVEINVEPPSGYIATISGRA